MTEEKTFTERLFDQALLIRTGVDGIYGRSGLFEDVINRFESIVSAAGASEGAEVVRFPPGMSRAHFEASGYFNRFPHLAGVVHSFLGEDLEHSRMLERMSRGDDWTMQHRPTDIALIPAACYPLYPAVALRGPLLEHGGYFDIQSYCFRREPSENVARMQFFRQREYVRLGTAEQVLTFRETWLQRGKHLIESLGLQHRIEIAHDAFFGRGGHMLKIGQRDGRLKFELLIPIRDQPMPTACMSFNYHEDLFGRTWNIRTADGAPAHTACIGFGLERVALALFSHHGLNVDLWPEDVRRRLWP